ncbi:MAG: cyclase, partial [Actinobacteria bacterium]|nr:cyclase [Actinomycetota bacterium]
MTTTVTTSVVFTDLVASTELASGLGPVAAEEVRSTHFGLLRDAVGATGGSV